MNCHFQKQEFVQEKAIRIINKNKKILFILHLPPPVHGSSTVGENIKESTIINDSFNCRYINLGTSISIDDIGQKRLGKIIIYFSILFKVFKELVIFKPHLCYLAITAKGRAFYKDALYLMVKKSVSLHLSPDTVKPFQSTFS